MTEHESFGVVPLQKRNNIWYVLLIQHSSGHWAFPKGHAEAGESHQQTAERELQEETGLTVTALMPFPPAVESYYFTANGSRIHKTVSYFFAEVEGKLVIQEQEIQNAKWVSLSDAMKYITYPATKGVCEKAIAYLL